ncbi:MAG: thrombospondin type 3 repeat-containing protein [Thermoleophilaceae bacterium]|nr:thrombospondin type 3 repeat-containing protein [Thermoleophilaceae bacterium]
MIRRAALTLTLALFAALALAATAQSATPRANLAASKLTATPTTLQAGASIAASLKITNPGSKAARATKTFFILSADARRSGDDLRLTSISTTKIKTSKSRTVKFAGAIPSTTPVGKRYLLACADGTRTIREKSERDNCKSQALTITAAAPAAGNTPTPPAPTGPTGPPNLPTDTDADGIADTSDNCPVVANADQADNDADAKGDLCDECPTNANPGAEFCAATVYAVKNGTLPIGSNVQLSGLVVTAVSGTSARAQLPVGHLAYTGVNYSAIQLIYPSAPSLQLGDVLSVGGMILGGLELQVANSTVTSTQSLPAATVLTGAELNALGQAMDCALVTVNNATSVSAYNTTGWLMTDGTQFAVLPTILGTLPSQGAGFASITGIKSDDGVNQILLPRTAADIGAPL